MLGWAAAWARLSSKSALASWERVWDWVMDRVSEPSARLLAQASEMWARKLAVGRATRRPTVVLESAPGWDGAWAHLP